MERMKTNHNPVLLQTGSPFPALVELHQSGWSSLLGQRGGIDEGDSEGDMDVRMLGDQCWLHRRDALRSRAPEDRFVKLIGRRSGSKGSNRSVEELVLAAWPRGRQSLGFHRSFLPDSTPALPRILDQETATHTRASVSARQGDYYPSICQFDRGHGPVALSIWRSLRVQNSTHLALTLASLCIPLPLATRIVLLQDFNLRRIGDSPTNFSVCVYIPSGLDVDLQLIECFVRFLEVGIRPLGLNFGIFCFVVLAPLAHLPELFVSALARRCGLLSRTLMFVRAVRIPESLGVLSVPGGPPVGLSSREASATSGFGSYCLCHACALMISFVGPAILSSASRTHGFVVPFAWSSHHFPRLAWQRAGPHLRDPILVRRSGQPSDPFMVPQLLMSMVRQFRFPFTLVEVRFDGSFVRWFPR
ncbi:hypothetical protein R1flu_023908 [Riccia fluitans]|uniref:Uncharacterized protein n=1 Tax=Riccia fluitans TaxID=41844 RepID=A0ABD1XTE2_9MARC